MEGEAQSGKLVVAHAHLFALFMLDWSAQVMVSILRAAAAGDFKTVEIRFKRNSTNPSKCGST